MATPFEVRLDGATFSGEADGFGLPVVFLHAEVTDKRMWTSQMKELADAGFHVISYDRRGFGDTESPDVPFNHLDDLEAILDQLSIHAAVFVGSSTGGALAIDFAIENPERTVGLVLVGTGLTGSPEAELPEEAELMFDALHYAEDRGNTGSINKIQAHLWLDGPLSPNGRVEGPARELFLEMNGKILAKPKLTKVEDSDPAEDAVGGITAPALLVVGDLDFPHVLERHSDLSDEMENSFAVVLEDTAHLPSLERPELFNPLLLEFLDAVAGHSDVGDDEDDDDDDDDEE